MSKKPNIRDQVFEVIVRQALSGAPWREICAGPMKVNDISERDVEAEVARRRAMGPDSQTRMVSHLPRVAIIALTLLVLLAIVAIAIGTS